MATTQTEKLDDVYDSRMHQLFQNLEALKSEIYDNMIAPDNNAAEEGLIDWGHAGDLERINNLLEQVRFIVAPGENCE